MSVSWAITPEKIEAAVKRIVSVAQPRKVILFGSVVAGKPDIHSDVDILVVTGDELKAAAKKVCVFGVRYGGLPCLWIFWSSQKSACRNWQINRASSTERQSDMDR